MSEIERVARRTPYENRWMKLHEDTVRFQDGSQGIYGIVDKSDFALVIPRHPDGRFQLVEQFRYPVGGRYWEFPQGAWETRSNTNPEALALGELQEETGLRASKLTKLGHLFEAYGYSNQAAHVFLAEDLEQGATARDPQELDMRTATFDRA